MPIRAFGVLTLLLGLAGCAASPKNTASAPAPEWFTDVAQAAGLDFTHVNGMSGRFYYPEIMAPGVGLFDYDNDGDLDVYVTQGHMLATGGPSEEARPTPQAEAVETTTDCSATIP